MIDQLKIYFTRYKHELILAVLVLLSRVPFITKFLYSWDAVQLSLALDNFNILKHQPHPPGYILYVGLGKLLYLFSHNANSAYILLGILATIFLVIFFYRFILLLINDRLTAFFGSLLIIFNPFIWFFSQVAATYVFDALFSVIFAYLSVKIIRFSSLKYLYFFAFLLGLSGGFRQTIIFFFTPMFLLAVILLLIRRLISFKQAIKTILLLIGGILCWFVPLILLSGGIDNYLTAINWQLNHAASASFFIKTGNLSALGHNLKDVIKNIIMLIGGGFLSIIMLIKINRYKFSQILSKRKNFYTYFFITWLIPSLAVYVLIHFGNRGYLMTIASALIGLLVIWLSFIFQQKKNLFIFIIIISLIGLILFFTPSFYYSWPTLKNIDQNLSIYFEAVKKLDPKDAIIVTENNFYYHDPEKGWHLKPNNYFRHAEYYLPQYQVYEIFWDDNLYFKAYDRFSSPLVASNIIPVDKTVKHVIIITDIINQQFLHQYNIKTQPLSSNKWLYIIDFASQPQINYYHYTFKK